MQYTAQKLERGTKIHSKSVFRERNTQKIKLLPIATDTYNMRLNNEKIKVFRGIHILVVIFYVLGNGERELTRRLFQARKYVWTPE